MHRALVERDGSFEGVFFACVRTTGIFCRPTCHARKPKPGNVEFVRTATEALHAGYRPCKVCDPLGNDPERPKWAQALLDGMAERPGERVSDATLRARGLEPAAVRRYFKKHFGVTFHAFSRSWRLGQAMKELHSGAAVGSTALKSGYNSESGFREAFGRLFGEAPGAARGDESLSAQWLESPLGPMIAIASARGIALLEFVDRRALEREIGDIRRHFKRAVALRENEHISQIREEIVEYFEKQRTEFGVALDAPASEFQQRVWGRIREIPHGEYTSYGTIATEIGRAGASRAVGRATGENRIAIVIPCHRVLRSDGGMSGYGGGVWRKKKLLELEGVGVLAGQR